MKTQDSFTNNTSCQIFIFMKYQDKNSALKSSIKTTMNLPGILFIHGVVNMLILTIRVNLAL